MRLSTTETQNKRLEQDEQASKEKSFPQRPEYLAEILELAKLSDLARLPSVKSVRVRLYYDAGVGTIEKMAEWDPKKLRAMLIDLVEKTRFNGIAPLPKEAENTVAQAKKLLKIVEYWKSPHSQFHLTTRSYARPIKSRISCHMEQNDRPQKHKQGTTYRLGKP